MRKPQNLECEEVCGDEKEEIVQGSVKALLHALVYISYIYIIFFFTYFILFFILLIINVNLIIATNTIFSA